MHCGVTPLVWAIAYSTHLLNPPAVRLPRFLRLTPAHHWDQALQWRLHEPSRPWQCLAQDCQSHCHAATLQHPWTLHPTTGSPGLRGGIGGGCTSLALRELPPRVAAAAPPPVAAWASPSCGCWGISKPGGDVNCCCFASSCAWR